MDKLEVKNTLNSNLKKSVFFIVLVGVVSLFSDMVYEGARSITGPFLETLHANAFVVGFFAGLGELIGYGLRLVSGYYADKTKKYWTFIFVGYGLTLLSVPLLALAGYWQLAVVFIIGERMGKAIRTPARDAMLALVTLATARFMFPKPEQLEVKKTDVDTSGFNRMFWIYIAASSFVAFGYADFPLIAYRLYIPLQWSRMPFLRCCLAGYSTSWV
jgi:hypothetical protein